MAFVHPVDMQEFGDEYVSFSFSNTNADNLTATWREDTEVLNDDSISGFIVYSVSLEYTILDEDGSDMGAGCFDTRYTHPEAFGKVAAAFRGGGATVGDVVDPFAQVLQSECEGSESGSESESDTTAVKYTISVVFKK